MKKIVIVIVPVHPELSRAVVSSESGTGSIAPEFFVLFKKQGLNDS